MTMELEKKAKLQAGLLKAYHKMTITELIETKDSLAENIILIDEVINFKCGDKS